MDYIAPFQFTGLVSGLDWQALVDRLMELESRPVQLMEKRKEAIARELDAWASVGSALLELQSKLEALRPDSAWSKVRAVSSDQSVLAASAGPGAVAGTHTVRVLSLAACHTVASDPQPDGALGLSGVFSVNGKEVAVEASDALADIARKISDSGAALAWVVDGRLVVRSLTPGTSGALRMQDVSGSVLHDLGVLGSGDLALRAFYVKSPAPGPGYPDAGGEFTDGLEGTEFRDGLSFGYSGTDLGVPGGGPASVEVTVDLGQVADLTGVKLVSGGGPGSSYCADSVEVLTSADGVNFVSQGTASGTNARELALSFSAWARWVKFRISKNFAPANQPGDWLFLDEGYVYGSGFKNVLQAPRDASLEVDGLPVVRSSNVVSDVLPGVTLVLKSCGQAEVAVEPDAEAVAGDVARAADACSALVGLLNSLLAKGATLQADAGASGLLVGLRRLLTDFAARLRAVGISIGADGRLVVDRAALAEAVARDAAGVRSVFFDGAGGGLGDRLLVYLGGWTGSSGSVALRQRTLQRMSEDLSERIEAFRRVLERRRQLLVARFVEMERVLSQLASQVSGLERLARAG